MPAGAAPASANAPPPAPQAAPAAALLSTGLARHHLTKSSPAPAPAPAPGPSPGPAEIPPPFDVFVELLPGEEAVEDWDPNMPMSFIQRQKKQLPRAATTKVSASITEKKGNGVQEIPIIKGCV